ncbi:homeodomain-interacting protein kinase 1-like isoform X2 [Siniperca chuatsi]|uniref:homeodomain-interacting protein kinase 1-like isoform X2 n=1 Tax=Siniperca chuatsi TaxID=119488 RepID=UPI001CE113E5|nr:homeodomain-interacting protein kinase 1-like isoform X2 [Siniperca chuatsi]
MLCLSLFPSPLGYKLWEEPTSSSSSSSSGEESQAVLGVLSSPSSDYLVRSFLGEGAFGKVAKCVKAATKETVAVKIIKNSNFTSEAQNEVAILQQLRAFDSDRFNFVRCNDAFIDKEHVCLEFEMLDVSLMDFLEKKPSRSLSVKEIRPILHQMATTLQLLRSLGVVHTDLKPDNIMMVDRVNQPLKIKMIDFGLACHVSQTQWGSYIQPRYYRSPEVILGFPYTVAIDMWSLGCIAAELFLGYVLYPGSCEYDMLRHMVQTQGQLPQQLLNDGVKTICFFQRKRCRERRWRLKTPFEYGQATWTESYFTSLDDLKKVRPACHLSDQGTMAEMEDRENFVDLLKKMLHLDVHKRVTPSQLLEDPFITMNDIADSYPNSFYVKSCCETMEVCQDQSLSSDNRDQQASTSTTRSASLDQHNVSRQVPPAWHSRQEHPLVLGIASAVSSCLSIHEDQRSSEPQQLSFSIHEEGTRPERQLPITSEQAQSSKAITKPQGKRTRATFIRQKRRMMSLLHDFRQAPTEGPISTAEIKPRRKLTWATFIAAHSGSRSPDGSSSERKRRKMNPDGVQTLKELPQNSKEAPTEATSSKAKAKPQRKRMWATFIASHSGNRSPDSRSPERKMSLLYDSKEAQIEAPSSEVKMKPRRKRTWVTFVASHSGNRSPDSSSPERKRRKMSLDEVETQTKMLHNSNQASSRKSKRSESNNKNPDCEMRGKRRRRQVLDGLRTHKKSTRCKNTQQL